MLPYSLLLDLTKANHIFCFYTETFLSFLQSVINTVYIYTALYLITNQSDYENKL